MGRRPAKQGFGGESTDRLTEAGNRLLQIATGKPEDPLIRQKA